MVGRLPSSIKRRPWVSSYLLLGETLVKAPKTSLGFSFQKPGVSIPWTVSPLKAVTAFSQRQGQAPRGSSIT